MNGSVRGQAVGKGGFWLMVGLTYQYIIIIFLSVFAQISLVHKILVGSRRLWIWLVRVLAPTLWLNYYLIFSVFNCKELRILINISHAALTITLQVIRWVFHETIFAIRIIQSVSHIRIVGVLLEGYKCGEHTNARFDHKGAIHACTWTLAAQVFNTGIQLL